MAGLAGRGRSLEVILGLSRNPFTPLADFDPELTRQMFVPLAQDSSLHAMASDTLAGTGSAFVAVVGGPGMGRTTRLNVLAHDFWESEGEYILYEVSPLEGPDAIDDLLSFTYERSRSIRKALKKLVLGVSELSEEELERLRRSPASVGEALVDYLDPIRPVALLLDDAHNMLLSGDRWSFFFFESIRELVSVMPEGIMVVMTMSPDAFNALRKRHSALISRMHDRVGLQPLTDDEAIQIVDKRVSAFRVREPRFDLDPFTPEAVEAANRYARGVPKRLMEILSQALEAAVALRRTTVTEVIVDDVMDPERPLLDFLDRVPERYRREVETLVRDFGGGPTTLEKLALATEVPVDEEYRRLETLVAAGYLSKDAAGMYYIPKEVLEAGGAREEPSKRKPPRAPPKGAKKTMRVSKSIEKILRRSRRR